MTLHIINALTGEITERELNAEELAQQQIDNAQTLAIKKLQEAEVKTKAIAKAELLERLGITADEAKLLLA